MAPFGAASACDRISPPPIANANVKGLLNLRGAVVPVVATRTLLGLLAGDFAQVLAMFGSVAEVFGEAAVLRK